MKDQENFFAVDLGATSGRTILGSIQNGKLTQVDLPRNQKSGLLHAIGILKDIPGISIIELDTTDIIRHKLVTRIINAYQAMPGDNEL